MLDSTIDDLARYYVEYCLDLKEDRSKLLTHWVGTMAGEWAWAMPDLAWRLILSILRQNASYDILPILAAGPLEDLLVHHEDVFLDRIVQQAKDDPAFAKLLGGVWQNKMTDAGWKRLQAVWDLKSWGGIPK